MEHYRHILVSGREVHFCTCCYPVAYLSHRISASDDTIAKFSSALVLSGLAFVVVVAANTTLVPVFGLHWKTKIKITRGFSMACTGKQNYERVLAWLAK